MSLIRISVILRVLSCTNNGLDKQKIKLFLKNIDESYVDEYYELFIQNGIDHIDVIKTITIDDLKAIGVNKLGHRNRMMAQIIKHSSLQ